MASKYWGQDTNPGSLVSESVLLPTLLCCMPNSHRVHVLYPNGEDCLFHTLRNLPAYLHIIQDMGRGELTRLLSTPEGNVTQIPDIVNLIDAVFISNRSLRGKYLILKHYSPL